MGTRPPPPNYVVVKTLVFRNSVLCNVLFLFRTMNDELIGIVRFYTKKEKTLCRIYLSVHKKNSFVFPENHVIPNILQRPPPLPPPDKY